MVVFIRVIIIIFIISYCPDVYVWGAGIYKNKKLPTTKNTVFKKNVKNIKMKKKSSMTSKPMAIQKTTAQQRSIHLEPIYIYSAVTKSYIHKISGVALTKNIIAARLPQEITYAQMQDDLSFILGQKNRNILKIFDIDIRSRWMVFYTNAQNLVVADAEHIEKNYLIFKYLKKEQLIQDWRNLNALLEVSRRTPSNYISLPILIENKFTEYESRMIADLIKSQKSIKVGYYDFGPIAPTFECQKKIIDMNSIDFLHSVKSAMGVGCQSTSDIEISEVEKIHYGLYAGVLTLGQQNPFGMQQRKELIMNLLPANVESVKKLSLNISESGPAICQFSTIGENQVDVYFCTRHSRIFNSMSDTVITLGKRVNDKYYFNQVRAEGFQPINTQKIISKYISAIGEQK